MFLNVFYIFDSLQDWLI